MTTKYRRFMSDQPLSAILQQFLERNHREEDFMEHAAAREFINLLPEEQRAQVKVVKTGKGVLWVKTTLAVLRFELVNRRTTLVAQLNEKLGKPVIKEIRFL